MIYDKQAEAVVDFFLGRKNFCGWWDDIDEETQAEILKELSALLESFNPPKS